MWAMDKLRAAEHILVFGARLYALEAVLRLSHAFPEKILGCAVSSKRNNPLTIAGFHVQELSAYEVWKDSTCVVISLRSIFYNEIREMLHKRGFFHVLTWNELGQDYSFWNLFEERLQKASVFNLVGDGETMLQDLAFLQSVLPEKKILYVAQEDVSPEAMALVDIGLDRDMECINLVQRLWDNGCRNIAEFEYLTNHYTRSPFGGGKNLLYALLWQRQKWRLGSKQVINKSRLRSKAMIES